MMLLLNGIPGTQFGGNKSTRCLMKIVKILLIPNTIMNQWTSTEIKDIRYEVSIGAYSIGGLIFAVYVLFVVIDRRIYGRGTSSIYLNARQLTRHTEPTLKHAEI